MAVGATTQTKPEGLMNLLHPLLALFAAAPVETWECKDYMESGWKNIIVVATIDEDRATGSIEVAGTTQPTIYHVKGFNRRWDFGHKRVGVTRIRS
jgi:hypothetical protein